MNRKVKWRKTVSVANKGSRIAWLFFLASIGVAVAAPPPVKIIPATAPDPAAAFRAAVDELRGAGGGTIRFERATYRLTSAVPVAFRASNHSACESRPVFLPVTNAAHIVVEGNGALLEVETPGVAMLVRDSSDVAVRDLAVDWRRPVFTEAVIEGYEQGGTRVRIDNSRFPVERINGWLHGVGPGWKLPLWGGNVFRRDTREIVAGTADVRFDGKAKDLGGGRWLLSADLSKIGEGCRPGDVFVIRVQRNGCIHPGLCADRSKDVSFSNTVVHAAWGKAVLVQMSENFSFVGGGVYPRPETGRIASHACDAVHVSNVKGRVVVGNARFATMFDDALNVHSTCLAIESVEPRRIRCRYVHPEAYGFGVFRPGDKLRFLRAKTLEDGPEVTVESVGEIDAYHLDLRLQDAVPDGIAVGDAVENADFQPSVVFRGNTVSCNRARGILLTTPKPILVESNLFERVSGCAILMPGDANGWYESGGCRDVRIRGNVFRHCLTSMFQFCEGIVSVFPEVRDLDAQRARYHRNLLVEDNRFETHDAPLLYAQSVSGLIWRRNEIVPDELYAGWRKSRYRTPHCENVLIEPLSVEGDCAEPPKVVLTGAQAEDAFNRVGSPVPVKVPVEVQPSLDLPPAAFPSRPGSDVRHAGDDRPD